MLTFYDSSGTAVAHLDDDGESLYLYDGEPVAWLSEGSVFAYSGSYPGWFEDGWIYDRSGSPALFTDDASGGPRKPVRAVRGIRNVRAVRPVREVTPVRPVLSSSWSEVSGPEYFSQSPPPLPD